MMRLVRHMVGWIVPLTAGFLASAVVSTVLAAGITAVDLTGALSVVVAVTTWCVVIAAAAKLYAR